MARFKHSLLFFYIKIIIYQNTSLYTTLHPRVQISKHPQFPQIKINSVNIFSRRFKFSFHLFFPSHFLSSIFRFLTRLCNPYFIFIFFKKTATKLRKRSPIYYMYNTKIKILYIHFINYLIFL